MKENQNADLKNCVQEILKDLIKNNKKKSEEDRKEKIQKQFKDLIEPTTEMGNILNSYGNTGTADAAKPVCLSDHEAELSFCGFLEGDFSERSYLQTPITFSGGFFLRTHVANILFDPGNGTIVGMRDMGIHLNPETDIIIVSHYHPQARLDLHTIFNELGGYCPGRSESDKSREKKVHFFSTEAVLKSRNEHPALLIPSDKKVIKQSYITEPGKIWRISGINNICQIEENPQNTEPDKNSLILKTFPAYHSEVVSDTNGEDKQGKEGKAVSCFFIQAETYGILFTGDTEYPIGRGRWSDKMINQLKDKVTVLIANMKTIEYLSKDDDEENNQKNQDKKRKKLRLTDNQLGFEGTKRLAELLNPKALIIRALGLECVVEKDSKGNLKYAPQKLSVIREAMELSLKEKSGNSTKYVIIPGRHQVFIRPDADDKNNGVKIEEKILVPAFSKTGVRRYGKKISAHPGQTAEHLFVTANQELAKEIDMYIAELKKQDNEKPWLLIQGETGAGKSMLAEAIVTELADIGNQEKQIRHYDLATAGKSDLFGADLFGWKKGAFTGAVKDFEGYLGIKGGLLILNQLEKLEPGQSAKFLDLLENRRYRQLGSTKDRETNARLIFTSNIDIDSPDSLLTEDMKNRLRHRILNIPRLNSLPREIRNAEVSEFIKFWCEKEQAVIDSRAWEMLLHLDFSRGAFRMLSGLLHKAKWMMEKEYGINTSESGTRSPVFISRDFIEMAKEKLDLGKKAKVCADVSAGSGVVRKELAWITAVWISYSCEQKKNYELILGSGRKTKNGLTRGTIGSPKFKEILAEFMLAFESRPEEAWNFFFAPEAVNILNSDKDMVKYIDSLNVKDSKKTVDDIFAFHKIAELYNLSKKEWLAERSEKMSEILKDPGKVKNKFLEVMDNLT